MLNRSRLAPVAIALALLLPGLGGSWLRVGHTCVGMEAGRQAGTSHAHPGQHEHASQPEGMDTCKCVGACQAPALTVPPTAATVVVAVRAAERPDIAPSTPEWLPAFRPIDFLPLPNAPPAA